MNQHVKRSGSVFLGIIGAIIGCIVGLIPNILVANYSKTMFSILMAIVPICIAFGYYLFSRSGGVFAIVLTILLSLFAGFVFHFFSSYHAFYQEMTGSVTNLTMADIDEIFESFHESSVAEQKKFLAGMNGVTTLPKDSSYPAFVPFYIDLLQNGGNDIWLEIGQALFFMLLGLIVSFRLVSRVLVAGGRESKTRAGSTGTIPQNAGYQPNQQQDGVPQAYQQQDGAQQPYQQQDGVPQAYQPVQSTDADEQAPPAPVNFNNDDNGSTE